MQSIERAPRPAAWQDEGAVLRGLCHAFASAESQDEAVSATPAWVRAALGAPEATSVREFAERVRTVRGSPREEVVTLRHADLEVIARAAGRDRHELLDLLAAAARRPS